MIYQKDRAWQALRERQSGGCGHTKGPGGSSRALSRLPPHPMHTFFLFHWPPTHPPTHPRNSAGIGENSAPMRREFCRDMEFAGVQLDGAKNEGAPRGAEADVSADGSRVKVGGWVRAGRGHGHGQGISGGCIIDWRAGRQAARLPGLPLVFT